MINRSLQIHHLALPVNDLEKMRTFYQDFLGLPLMETQHDQAGNVRSYWLNAGDIILMLEKASQPITSQKYFETLTAFTISADQRKTWQEKLLAAEIVIEKESCYSIYFRDPEENRLALSHYPEKV